QGQHRTVRGNGDQRGRLQEVLGGRAAQFLARSQVPDVQGVVRGGGEKGAAVPGHLHRRDVVWRLQPLPLPAGGGVPKENGPPGRRGERAAVRREGGGADPVLRTVRERFAAGQVEPVDHAAEQGGSQGLAVRREGQRQRIGVPKRDAAHFLPR